MLHAVAHRAAPVPSLPARRRRGDALGFAPRRVQLCLVPDGALLDLVELGDGGAVRACGPGRPAWGCVGGVSGVWGRRWVLGPSCGSKKGRVEASEASAATVRLAGARGGRSGVAALLGAALLVLQLVVGRWSGMRNGEIAAFAVGAADAAGAALTRALAASV